MTTATDNKIECAICGARIHAVQMHLRDEHPEVSIEDYKRDYPEAPLLSDSAKRIIEERQRAAAAAPDW